MTEAEMTPVSQFEQNLLDATGRTVTPKTRDIAFLRASIVDHVAMLHAAYKRHPSELSRAFYKGAYTSLGIMFVVNLVGDLLLILIGWK